MIDVTLVTRNASQDALTDAAYLGIIDSLRGPLFGYSWQQIADATEYNSKAYWHQVHKGTRQLDDAAKNALRRVTDGELPEQPISVSAAVERFVHKDAEVSMVGPFNFDDPDARVHRVLLMADNNVTVHVNGEVHAEPLQGATTDVEGTELPASAENAVAGRTAIHSAKRAPVYRPVFSIDEQARFDELGGIRNVLAAGMAALGVTAETGEA